MELMSNAGHTMPPLVMRSTAADRAIAVKRALDANKRLPGPEGIAPIFGSDRHHRVVPPRAVILPLSVRNFAPRFHRLPPPVEPKREFRSLTEDAIVAALRDSDPAIPRLTNRPPQFRLHK
jgi:hypothetical protein